MVFANKGTTHFALEQDRALLTAVNKHGYGNWDSVREEIRTDNRLRFQHSVQGMNVQAIAKRCDYRMRQMEKELEAREKSMKNKRPPSSIAAQKAIEAVKEMDFWDMQAREAQLSGEEPPDIKELSAESRQIMGERLKERDNAIARLREIEVQVQRCLAIAEETRQAIFRGEQYVNYSSITLKAGGPATTGMDESTGLSLQDNVDMEARINSEILKIPACNQCENCTNSNTKLCVHRLKARQRLIFSETERLQDLLSPKQKKMKKRKLEALQKTPPSLPESAPRMKTVSAERLYSPSSSPPPASVSSSAANGSGPVKKKKKLLMMKQADGQLKPRVTSQGNKRMTIPDELFPEFCRRITAQGTGERMKLISQFVEDHPTISIRQVTLKFSEITTKTRPPWHYQPKQKGRAFHFYLRPRFYKYLEESERPEDWQRYAAEDELLWQKEQEEKKSVAQTEGSKKSDDGDETEDDEPAKSTLF